MTIIKLLAAGVLCWILDVALIASYRAVGFSLETATGAAGWVCGCAATLMALKILRSARKASPLPATT